MASSKKPEQPKLDDTQEIVDAVIVEDDDAQGDTPEEATGTPGEDTEATGDDPVTPDAPERGDDDGTSAADAQPDADSEITAEPGEGDGAASVEARPDATGPVDSAPEPQPVVIRKGGFLAMVLGGIAAAAIGFGAARYVLPEGWPWPGTQDDTALAELTESNAAQESRIDEIAGALDGLDLQAMQDQVAGNADTLTGLSTRIDEVAATLSDLQARLETLETRPVAEPGSADANAFAAELRALQDSVEAQRSEIDTLLSDAQAREAAAEATAQEALARAALSRVQTALDTGSDFSGALADLRAAGVSVPAALADQAAGVQTLAQLSAAFPEAAREALSAARRASGQDGGLGGFLRTQLGVRSLEPQEGAGPDAVLSRAEAALRADDIDTVLAELQALPEAGLDAMTPWIADAELRRDAVAAADGLAAQLDPN